MTNHRAASEEQRHPQRMVVQREQQAVPHGRTSFSGQCVRGQASMLAQHVMVPPPSDWCVCVCVSRWLMDEHAGGGEGVFVSRTPPSVSIGEPESMGNCECRELGWGFDGETGSLHICMPICGGMQHAEERMRYLGRTNSSVSLSLGERWVPRRHPTAPTHHPPILPPMLTAYSVQWQSSMCCLMAVTPGSCFASRCCHPLDRRRA
ncbi:hypothetical protein QBC39DRAFT_22927 [Podospora conica]|nr:hypothetical protein QBC39DRAFT_22927 [Schizothecium conicum]